MGHEVARNVLGEFLGSTLFYEENGLGGIEIYSFLRLWAWVHRGWVRRGDHCVQLVYIGGI
jgi:hypothetical protein